MVAPAVFYAPGQAIAFSGQTTSHALQAMQSRGRGNQGKTPTISKHAVGHAGTQSPQPVQRVSFSSGNSRVGFTWWGLRFDGRRPVPLDRGVHE